MDGEVGTDGPGWGCHCGHCGSRVDLASWHPVAAPPGAGGRVIPFCCESCRSGWLAARSPAADD